MQLQQWNGGDHNANEINALGGALTTPIILNIERENLREWEAGGERDNLIIWERLAGSQR